jgi:protein-S-isoprenylcysteine O-methyltransferase Ste14
MDYEESMKREDTKVLVKAILIGGSVIFLIVTGLFWLSSLVTGFLELPPSLNIQQPFLRIGGLGILLAGGALALWLFKYRDPRSMIVSTYYTFVKMFTRAPVSKEGSRTEPLITEGPQKYVRNPLYLSAVICFLGWALLTDRTSSLIGVLFVLVWFVFVQIPFEEKELRTFFGDQYVFYSKAVPMLIPFTKRKTHSQKRLNA